MVPTRGDDQTNHPSYAEQDDDIVGEIVPPGAIDASDIKRIVQIDHNYHKKPESQPQYQPTPLTASAIHSAGINFNYKPTGEIFFFKFQLNFIFNLFLFL